MHWIKERILEAHWMEPDHVETSHLIYTRLRSDGSMWYQIVRRDGEYDHHRDRLEARFSDFLKADPKEYGARIGHTEQEFDEDFLDRLKRMGGTEVIQSEIESRKDQ